MSNSYVVLIELEERRVGSNLGHRPKFSWRILIGSHSRTPPILLSYPILHSHSLSKWFYDTSNGATLEQPDVVLSW
jgi:hypothetical protein